MNKHTSTHRRAPGLRSYRAIFLCAILSAGFVADTFAGLIAYDPMNYTGSQINTGTAAPSGTPNQATGTGGGFTGNWSGGALTLNSTGLAYANLPVAGKSIANLGANNLYTHIAGAPTSGSVWVSFLFKQTGDNGGNRSGVFLENSSGAGVMLSYQQFSGSQGEPCLMAMSGTTTVGTQIGTSTHVQTYANTNLYVLQFVYTGGVVTSVSVYSNPTAGQNTAPAADFTVTTGLPSFGALVNFGLYDGSAEGITLDEFRVGTSFGDVVGVSVIPVNVSITSPTNNQTVSIYNFTATANATVVPGSIASVAFYLDSTLVTNLTASPYTATISGVSAGAHTLYAVATDSSANVATSSIVNITAMNLSPSVTLTNPVNNASLLTGSNVLVGASASDDGSVNDVAFYVDGTLIGDSTVSPYSAAWVVTAGAHALTAVATDNTGLMTTSAVVNVTGTLPTTAITSPTNNQSVSIYTFAVHATASVSPGTITNVALYLDSTLYANATASPYNFAVTGAGAGAHTLYTVAVDSNGNSVTSSVIDVVAGDLPPSVTLTNPVNNASLLTGSVIAVGAAASDDNAVTNVAFFVDGNLLGNSVAAPYSATWIVTAGAHALTAVATDSAGQPTTSAVVNVTGTLPVVSVTSPTNNQTVSIYSLSATVSATVSPGTITNVALYFDSALFTNKTSAPYTFVIAGASAGAHSLYAIATDSNGNNVTSATINVTAADLPPTVTLTNPVAGSAILGGGSVTLGAAAADDSAVTNVSFYVDGNLVGNATNSPYSATWNVSSLGSHALTAVATDNAGQSTTSAVVNVTAVLNFNVYEPFNYATGSLTNGTPSTGTGFKNNWICGNSGTIVSSLSYANLPTADNALFCNGSYQIEDVAGVVSSGTLWVSVLFQQAGDNGGNRSGFLMEDSTGKGLMFAYTQATGTQGFPSLVNVSATNTVGSTLSTKSSTLRTYNTPNFYVFKLTYTSGALSSVAVYSDPTAGQATAPTADFTVSGLSGIGVISQFGVASPSGMGITIDEIRSGITFAAPAGVALPSAPLNPVAAAGNTQVSLTWSASATGSPTGYNVKRSTTSGLETTIGSTAGTNFVDTTVTNGTLYYYVISGTNAAGEGANSVEVSATPVSAPGQVQNLIATAGTNSVTLTFSPVSGAIGYLILRGTNSGDYTVTNGTPTNGYFDATAAGSTTYYYVVEATNAGGIGPISLEVSATPTNSVPLPPSMLVATPANSQVSLMWSVGVGATDYNIKRSTTSGAETTIATTANTSFTDLTAVNGNIYYYEVSSTNSAGESSDSNEAIAAMPPAAPTGLTPTPGSNQVSLSWTASAGPSGAASYNVKRSTNSLGGFATIGSTAVASYLDLTAISGTAYYYEVSGVNASGEGNNSTAASATPTGAPQPPTGVAVVTNYTSLTIKWNASQGNPSSYNVKRSTTSGTETVLPAGANVTGTSFTDTTVGVGTNYFYTVSAVNGDGESANSSEVSGSAPGTPLAYESFDYTTLTNGTLTTASGFSGDWMITNGATIVSGLTYQNLFTSNSAVQVSSGSQYEKLSVPLFSGTVYVSFLYSQSGDFGGNRGGLQLLNDSGNGIMFAYHQFGGQVGLPSIDSITSYGNVGDELGVSTTPQTYATANLYVIRLDYDSTGAVTNLSFYTNPSPGQTPTPDFSITSGLSGIGTITTLGMHTGILTTSDEWRVGTTLAQVIVGRPFATVTLGDLNQAFDGTPKAATATTVPPGLTVDLTYEGSTNAPSAIGTYQVIGTVDDTNYYGSATNTLTIYNPVNTTPTNIVASVSGNQLTLTWPADHTGFTLQSQTNTLGVGVTTNWFDVAGSTNTNTVTFTIDPTKSAVFYRLKF